MTDKKTLVETVANLIASKSNEDFEAVSAGLTRMKPEIISAVETAIVAGSLGEGPVIDGFYEQVKADRIGNPDVPCTVPSVSEALDISIYQGNGCMSILGKSDKTGRGRGVLVSSKDTRYKGRQCIFLAEEADDAIATVASWKTKDAAERDSVRAEKQAVKDAEKAEKKAIRKAVSEEKKQAKAEAKAKKDVENKKAVDAIKQAKAEAKAKKDADRDTDES